MNILIPHSWLLEHLDTKAKPEKIQECLSLSGPSVERIYEIEGEPVYDIEVTTNRVDAMSVRGIAREAAVILQQFGIKATLKPLKLISEPKPAAKATVLPLPKINNDPNLSRRISCIVLKGVKRTATPDWMAKRLLQTEMNVHDSVIDITNYITHEIGYPVHAFDYDKLMNTGGEINVVEAEAGETFITLDGTPFTTVGGEVVFKNGQNEIIDLPSIKGTENTSIDESTENVLLLTEAVKAKKVRFASMTHAIRTTAAQLMEKNADPHLAPDIIFRGVELYQKLCDAQVASKTYDEFPDQKKPAIVKMSLEKIDQYLGLELSQAKIVKILKDLGCEVEVEQRKKERQNKLVIQPPTFRPDLKIPADIIEEVARIYGYYQLPSVLMDTPIPTTYPTEVDFHLENKIKRFLSLIGWQELYTYSMVSEELAQESGFALHRHLKIQNPLTEDRVYMRRSLLPSLQEILDQNSRRLELSVFEIANLYKPTQTSLPEETAHLSLVSSKTYRQVRGDLEALLANLYVKDVKINPVKKASYQFDQEAQIKARNHEGQLIKIGKIGVLKNGRIGASLAISDLMKVVHTHPSYQAIPKTMPILEDMTFKLPAQTQVGEVINTMERVADVVKKVELKDVYHQNHTFTVTYHNLRKNLTTEEIEPLRKKIVAQVKQEHKGKLVGQV